MSGPILPTTLPVLIGGGPAVGCNGNYTFDGLIDEPAIYNRALSSAEIAAIYSAGSAGKCAANPPPPPPCTGLVTVTAVLPPEQATQVLLWRTQREATNSRPLVKPLHAALISIYRHNPAAAITALQLFQSKTHAELGPRGDPLVKAAQDIIDALACGGASATPLAPAVMPTGSQPPLEMKSVQRTPDGTMSFRFAGTPPSECLVEASEDFVNWELIGSARARPDGSFTFTDSDAATHPQRFYRLVSP